MCGETQGTTKHKRFQQEIVFVRCKKIDRYSLNSVIIIHLSFYTWRKKEKKKEEKKKTEDENAFVSLYLVFRRIGEYISLDLF